MFLLGMFAWNECISGWGLLGGLDCNGGLVHLIMFEVTGGPWITSLEEQRDLCLQLGQRGVQSSLGKLSSILSRPLMVPAWRLSGWHGHGRRKVITALNVPIESAC